MMEMIQRFCNDEIDKINQKVVVQEIRIQFIKGKDERDHEKIMK